MVRAVGITPEWLLVPAVAERLAYELERGDALHQVDLLRDITALGRGPEGKVSAVLHGLRQFRGWGKKDAGSKDHRPDTEAAVSEIERMLARLGKL